MVSPTVKPLAHEIKMKLDANDANAFSMRSADGTTIFTTSSSNRVCAFALPSDLLGPREEPARLEAHGTLRFPEATNVIAPCPYFSLDNPDTQLVLTAIQDHPIHLYNAFPPPEDEAAEPFSVSRNPPPVAHYNLIKSTTEQYLPVRSLIWPSAGTHFIAGTNDLVAVFDISRTEPVLPIKTIPSGRHRSAGHGVGMRGTVAALAAHPSRDGGSSLIAAGTWTRHIALYDLMRGGETVATWSVKDAAPDLGGDGIVQTGWSPCGNYLLINERQSNGLLVYDLEVRSNCWRSFRAGLARPSNGSTMTCSPAPARKEDSRSGPGRKMES